MQPGYEHKQQAPLHFLLVGIGTLVACLGLSIDETPAKWVCYAVAAVVMLFASMFVWMNVRDEDLHLAIRYGPLPVFRATFAYRDISAVEPSRSSVIDGWGIHYVPCRGWTYNLWGFDCVKVRVNGATVRIGTDDVHGLTEFLATKINLNAEAAS